MCVSHIIISEFLLYLFLAHRRSHSARAARETACVEMEAGGDFKRNIFYYFSLKNKTNIHKK